MTLLCGFFQSEPAVLIIKPIPEPEPRPPVPQPEIPTNITITHPILPATPNQEFSVSAFIEARNISGPLAVVFPYLRNAEVNWTARIGEEIFAESHDVSTMTIPGSLVAPGTTIMIQISLRENSQLSMKSLAIFVDSPPSGGTCGFAEPPMVGRLGVYTGGVVFNKRNIH